MRSVNKVILIGNLTRDPELRETQSGQPVTTFSVATNRVWVTKTGQQQNSTEYHDCVAWARLAEICSQYLKKSKLVYIEGYLKTRSWDSPEGVRKFKTEVVVQDMIMLDKRPRGEEGEEIDEIIPMDDSSPETIESASKDKEEVAEVAVEEAVTEEPKEETPAEEVATEKPEVSEPASEEVPAKEEKKEEENNNESSVF